MTWYQWATAGAALCAIVLTAWQDSPRPEPAELFMRAATGTTPEERPRNSQGDDDQGYVY